MNINKEISDFLRDAQYKLALITIEMDKCEDDGDVYYSELRYNRWELDYFYSILYETSQALSEGYNWLSSAGWTDKKILSEIHYLRRKHRLNGMPVIDYGTVTNKIVTFVLGESSSEGGTNLPVASAAGKLLTSNALGGWEEGSLTSVVGMIDGESLNTYFSGRL